MEKIKAIKSQPAAHYEVELLCLLWYVVSISSSFITKALLSDFPYPMTVTMVQLTVVNLLSGPLFNLWEVPKPSGSSGFSGIVWHYYFKMIVPLALAKFLGNVLSHVSVWKTPVSYANTVKASIPLFTVIFSRLILHERQSSEVYFSLVPIVIGVAIATVTELSFDFIGLISAVASTMSFSLQSIFSKKVLHDTGIHHLTLLLILVRLSLLMFLPIWLIFDVRNLLHDSFTNSTGISTKIIVLLLIDSALNWIHNILIFLVLSKMTPLTFAVANATKLIFVITVSLLILGNPVTLMNLFGMTLAVGGVFYYSKIKYKKV